MFLKNLAKKIRGRREARGLKQQDIANALGVSPQAVSKWERGENAPDIAVVGELARLLDVSTDWLLSAPGEDTEVFEATVLVSSVRGAYEKSLQMKPRDFAVWANSVFFPLTEMVLRHEGVPIKYMGDKFLAFFSGTRHRDRAVKMALQARQVLGEDVKVGLSCGEIYLGSVGHPDYAQPDIMGEAVNQAFLTMGWAEEHSGNGIVATEAVVKGLRDPVTYGEAIEAKFLELDHPVFICELDIQPEA
jgi:transcriptional regulator with XRE-family HTH domain